MAKHYNVDEKKKTISFVIGSLTTKEKKIVKEYQEFGYQLVLAEEKPVEKLNLEDMEKFIMELASDEIETFNDKKALKGKLEGKTDEERKKIKQEHGYLPAKHWFIEKFPEDITMIPGIDEIKEKKKEEVKGLKEEEEKNKIYRKYYWNHVFKKGDSLTKKEEKEEE